MTTQVNPSDLRSIELLHGLDDVELRELISHCEVAQCPADTVLVTQGAEDRTLFFLLDGTAEVRLNVPRVGEEVVAELSPGSVFGEVSFFHPGTHTATVQCVAASRLMRLRRAKYDQLRVANSQMAWKIGSNAAELMAERLQQTDAWAAEQLQTLEDRRIHETWTRFRERTRRSSAVSGGFTVA